MIDQNNGHVAKFLRDSIEILAQLQVKDVEKMIESLVTIKNSGGRIFFAGSGGGAGHASHAACDFRKVLDIESYSISDNVSELTARVNDESWDEAYSNWLKVSRISQKDALFVISVGGGSKSPLLSGNLISAIDLAFSRGAGVLGIVGRDGGYLKRKASACVIVPTVNDRFVTAQTEGMQSLIWHLIITDPRLKGNATTWESHTKR